MDSGLRLPTAMFFVGLLDIVAMGRQLGYFVIVAMQRGSTKSIDGDVRAQFHLRCTLGKMDADGYKMAFGDNYKLKRTLKEKGSGFIQLEGDSDLEEPNEFYTPYIDKGYDLLKEIAKITNKNYSEIDKKKEEREEKKKEATKPITLSEYKDMKMTKEK
jgi:DNA segregation ATPase FtsK/SpoIIIE-like protein